MVKRYLACAVAIASALLASACAGSEQAASLPKKAALVTAPSAQPLTVEQQVEAAVRHYYDVANQAFRTGDTTELESLSVPSCPCRRLVTDTRRVFKTGRFDGLRMSATGLHVDDLHENIASVRVTVSASAYRQLSAAGSTVARFSPHSGIEHMLLARTRGVWIVQNVLLLQRLS